MKKLHPATVYILFLATAGIFGLVWAFSLMEDLNRRQGRKEFSLKRGVIFTVLIFLYGALSFPLLYPLVPEGIRTVFFLVQICIAGAWLVALFSTLVRFARAIGEMEDARGIEKTCTVGMAILLFFVYFGALPYLHSHYRNLE